MPRPRQICARKPQARLVFAPRVKNEEHLARHRLGDLFLDTLPYNAHTTGSDALWMGLPLVTCCGDSFAGRVGSSLLHAVGAELSEDETSMTPANDLAVRRALEAAGLR